MSRLTIWHAVAGSVILAVGVLRVNDGDTAGFGFFALSAAALLTFRVAAIVHVWLRRRRFARQAQNPYHYTLPNGILEDDDVGKRVVAALVPLGFAAIYWNASGEVFFGALLVVNAVIGIVRLRLAERA